MGKKVVFPFSKNTLHTEFRGLRAIVNDHFYLVSMTSDLGENK